MICCCGIELGSLAEIITCCLAGFAFLLSWKEFQNHKKRERINIITQFSKRYTEDCHIKNVVQYLESLEDKKEDLNPPNIHDIEMFMRFFEEISCLVKANSIKENITYYMFGHYLLIFAENIDKMPKELEYDKGVWTLFRDFVDTMKKAKESLYSEKTEDGKVDEYKINTNKIEL